MDPKGDLRFGRLSVGRISIRRYRPAATHPGHTELREMDRGRSCDFKKGLRLKANERGVSNPLGIDIWKRSILFSSEWQIRELPFGGKQDGSFPNIHSASIFGKDPSCFPPNGSSRICFTRTMPR